MVLLQEWWGVTCCSGWLCDCQDFMILQDPDDEERALHLEELHVVTFFDANASVIQGTRKNMRFKIWELEKNGGGGYHSTVERRNPKQPQPPGIFFETLQIMVDNYIITISTGDPWISSTINSITGIMVSPTGSSRTLGGRALCGWLPGAVCWDMFLFQLFIMLENGLEHGGLPPPPKKTPEKSEA